MLEMSEIAKKDLNGDGVLGPKDIWGLNYTRDEISGMLNSCGLQVGKVNADGNLDGAKCLAGNIPYYKTEGGSSKAKEAEV